jgi:hypothetical protein
MNKRPIWRRFCWLLGGGTDSSKYQNESMKDLHIFPRRVIHNRLPRESNKNLLKPELQGFPGQSAPVSLPAQLLA